MRFRELEDSSIAVLGVIEHVNSVFGTSKKVARLPLSCMFKGVIPVAPRSLPFYIFGYFLG